ncbi:hypothetical protein SAMN05216377_1157 [Pseudonocardia oroxyli]|uniref:HTH IS21-type domain-containing protein n=1 Tax=Pseudonocardia oroxyli TaxID=366584 RepID=A0A1G7WWU7_PSEOR|nr:hypothetical protein SAMN05216377_1157 [Pseudonocardia oroxyli]
MTAPSSIDSEFLHEQLSQASPDLLRQMLTAFINTIKEIARRLGVARNTVRAALASDRPPRYERARRGSVADPYEPQVRALLAQWPRMPGPVIAQRIDWPYSEGPLKKLLARIRPEYVGVDPVDRVSYEPGQLAQCDLWFPAPPIPVSPGQARVLPVLVIVLGSPGSCPRR